MSEVDLDAILGIGAYDLERAKTIDPAAFGLVPPEAEHGGHGEPGHGHANESAPGPEDGHGHNTGRHDPVITVHRLIYLSSPADQPQLVPSISPFAYAPRTCTLPPYNLCCESRLVYECV